MLTRNKTYNEALSNNDYIYRIRLTKCRNSSIALSGAGMCYPGLASETKSHLFKTICQPTLIYGLDSVPISNTIVK